jgi:excisionase family DNA binding protein
MVDQQERLLTVPEAAEMLRMSRKALYSWINSGLITAVDLPNGRIRIWHSELMRLVHTDRKVGAPSVKSPDDMA